MKTKKWLKSVWGMLVILAAFSPTSALVVNAQIGSIGDGNGGTLTTIDTAKLQEIGNSGSTFGEIVTWVVDIFLWVASAAAIIYLLISGFNYITAGGDQEKASNAQKGIINAVIGIVVIMAAFLIFNASRSLGEDIGDTGTGGGGNTEAGGGEAGGGTVEDPEPI